MGPTLISFLILGLLVLVHELGHFLVARWSGVRILQFSIGFGPRLWGWRRGETDYLLSAVPLGGYVKMAGEQREDHQHQPWEYLSKPLGTRARIIFAGPFVNYLLAAVSLWAVFVIGYPQGLPVIGGIKEDSPAQAAGLKVGDRILTINGGAIKTWDELTEIVHRSAGQALTLLIERDGRQERLTVTPRMAEITDLFGRRRSVGRIGVEHKGDAVGMFRVGPLAAIGHSLAVQAKMVILIGKGLWFLMSGQTSLRESLTGPIGIIVMTSNAVRSGITSVLWFVGFLSLSLAIFNLFPIPILDGGHLVFLGFEKLRGRPVSLNVQERATQISMAFLILLVVFVCVNDVNRLGWVEKVMGWWRD